MYDYWYTSYQPSRSLRTDTKIPLSHTVEYPSAETTYLSRFQPLKSRPQPKSSNTLPAPCKQTGSLILLSKIILNFRNALALHTVTPRT